MTRACRTRVCVYVLSILRLDTQNEDEPVGKVR